MVFVKVRETYDLHTTKGKMTVIGIHTPKPDIIKRSYPGLLMQCRAYRPVSADVRIACASMLPLDPQGVGLAEGDVAPEDVFNPILYKAMSNKGMSQLEARINYLAHVPTSADVDGNTATVDVDDVTSSSDEFDVYYGLLSNTHDWKHANPQSGLSMSNLRPLVYEMVYNVGDQGTTTGELAYPTEYDAPNAFGSRIAGPVRGILGKAKEMPFINCTTFKGDAARNPFSPHSAETSNLPPNCELEVPWINVVCGAIIVPPSRLHELFYRMVVEWTIEFSALRPIGEITSWVGLGTDIGGFTHYQNYSYAATKEAVTGDKETILEKDSCMVSANVDINKVM